MAWNLPVDWIKWLLRVASLSQFPFDLLILPLTVACHVAHRARHAMVTEVTNVSLVLFQNISWALHVSLSAQRGCSTARCLILVQFVMQLANRAVDQTTTTVTLVKVRNYYSLLRLGLLLGTGKIWLTADRRVQRSQKQLREISRFQFPSHSRNGELTYVYFAVGLWVKKLIMRVIDILQVVGLTMLWIACSFQPLSNSLKSFS